MTRIERKIMENEEKIQKRNENPKQYLRTLKAQRTKLLNKQCETEEQYEEVQNKLNNIDFQIMMLQNKNHIPSID